MGPDAINPEEWSDNTKKSLLVEALTAYKAQLKCAIETLSNAREVLGKPHGNVTGTPPIRDRSKDKKKARQRKRQLQPKETSHHQRSSAQSSAEDPGSKLVNLINPIEEHIETAISKHFKITFSPSYQLSSYQLILRNATVQQLMITLFIVSRTKREESIGSIAPDYYIVGLTRLVFSHRVVNLGFLTNDVAKKLLDHQQKSPNGVSLEYQEALTQCIMDLIICFFYLMLLTLTSYNEYRESSKFIDIFLSIISVGISSHKCRVAKEKNDRQLKINPENLRENVSSRESAVRSVSKILAFAKANKHFNETVSACRSNESKIVQVFSNNIQSWPFSIIATMFPWYFDGLLKQAIEKAEKIKERVDFFQKKQVKACIADKKIGPKDLSRAHMSHSPRLSFYSSSLLREPALRQFFLSLMIGRVFSNDTMQVTIPAYFILGFVQSSAQSNVGFLGRTYRQFASSEEATPDEISAQYNQIIKQLIMDIAMFFAYPMSLQRSTSNTGVDQLSVIMNIVIPALSIRISSFEFAKIRRMKNERPKKSVETVAKKPEAVALLREAVAATVTAAGTEATSETIPPSQTAELVDSQAEAMPEAKASLEITKSAETKAEAKVGSTSKKTIPSKTTSFAGTKKAGETKKHGSNQKQRAEEAQQPLKKAFKDLIDWIESKALQIPIDYSDLFETKGATSSYSKKVNNWRRVLFQYRQYADRKREALEENKKNEEHYKIAIGEAQGYLQGLEEMISALCLTRREMKQILMKNEEELIRDLAKEEKNKQKNDRRQQSDDLALSQAKDNDQSFVLVPARLNDACLFGYNAIQQFATNLGISLPLGVSIQGSTLIEHLFETYKAHDIDLRVPLDDNDFDKINLSSLPCFPHSTGEIKFTSMSPRAPFRHLTLSAGTISVDVTFIRISHATTVSPFWSCQPCLLKEVEDIMYMKIPSNIKKSLLELVERWDLFAPTESRNLKNNLSHVSKVIAQHCFVTPTSARSMGPSFCFRQLSGDPKNIKHLEILITCWLPIVETTIQRCWDHIFNHRDFDKTFFFKTIELIINNFIGNANDQFKSNPNLCYQLNHNLNSIFHALNLDATCSNSHEFRSTNYQPVLWSSMPSPTSPLSLMPVDRSASY